MDIITSPSPLVRFADAMTRFQAPARPGSDRVLTSEIGMRAALDATAVSAIGENPDRETVIRAVMSGIRDALERSTVAQLADSHEGEPTRKAALQRAAEIFADEFWSHRLADGKRQSREPGEQAYVVETYGTAFERAHERRAAKRAKTANPSSRRAEAAPAMTFSP